MRFKRKIQNVKKKIQILNVFLKNEKSTGKKYTHIYYKSLSTFLKIFFENQIYVIL